LFIGHEGWDLAFRLINAGHELVYTPSVRVQHMVDPTVRPSSRIYYTFTRNAIWVALRNHRPAPAIRSIAQDLALMGFAALRAGELGAFRRAIVDAARGARHALDTRVPLSPGGYARLAAIRGFKPSLSARVIRHLRERLI